MSRHQHRTVVKRVHPHAWRWRLLALLSTLTVCVAAGVWCGLALVALAAVAAPAPEAQAAPPEGTVSVRDFFKGKVTKLTKKGEIEIHYDFEDPGQLADFSATLPYRAIRSAEESHEKGRLRIKGTGSFRHKAVFGERIESKATFLPLKPRNFGFAVTEERESEVFTLYCVQDTYFSLGDGVTHPQNMIIKFIPRDPKINRDGFQDWRYCGSYTEKPKIQRNAPLEVRIQRGGNESRMFLLDWKTGGKEWDRDLTELDILHAAVNDYGDYLADALPNTNQLMHELFGDEFGSQFDVDGGKGQDYWFLQIKVDF